MLLLFWILSSHLIHTYYLLEKSAKNQIRTIQEIVIIRVPR